MKRRMNSTQDQDSPKSPRIEFSDTDEDLLVRAVEEFERVFSYKCEICGKILKTGKSLKRHKLSHMSKHTCSLCGATYNRRDNLSAHKKKKHGIKPVRKGNIACSPSKEKCSHFQCKHCSEMFYNYADLFKHVDETHPLNQSGGRKKTSTTSPGISNVFETATGVINDELPETKRNTVEETAIQRSVQNLNVFPKDGEQYDLLTFLARVRENVVNILHSRVREIGGIKWNICVQVEMERDVGDGTLITTSPFFRSRSYILLNVETFNDHNLHEALQKIHASMEKYLREGSGWYMKKVVKLEIHTIAYSPLSGSSYIPLPKSLALCHGVLNIMNADNRCFLYSILASLHPARKNSTHVGQYISFTDEINMIGIQYPVPLSQIDKFENQNPSLSVNVFGYDDKEIFPLKITLHPHRLHHVDLLWLKSGEKSHYCLITDLNRFLSRIKGYKGSFHFCSYCLHGFTKESLLQDHISYCRIHGAQKVELPIPGQNDTLEFKEFEKTLRIPFVIYADFETLNVKLPTCPPSSNHSSRTPITKLEVCGFGYKVVCMDPMYTKPTVVYRGMDASSKLIDSLLLEMTNIQKILEKVKPMTLTDEDIRMINKPIMCCICKQNFSHYYLSSNKLVRHHNHVTGAFIGMAHNHCNLNCQQVKHIPVIFHNLKNFDAHIVCQNIGKFKDRKLKCIAQNSERYVSFSLGDLRFIDSFQFLPSSLETLVDDLAKDGVNAFPHVLTEFPKRELAELLLRKGVYPYDYMSRESRFYETSLPKKEEFYSNIKQEGISSTDYAHAQNVFKQFKLQTLGQYHDLYLKTDVILLCDVFEAFRDVCMKQYDLDAAHFYTSPGLSWAACLKMTEVKLELMTDIDQILFVEQGSRGGISQVCHRHKKANNPYLEDFNPSKPTSYLQYLDMNNLYGYAMIQKLPIGSFRFLDKQELEDFNLYEVSAEDDIGYILEVSLHYPSQYHTDHNDYPLAPETKHIPNDYLSPYAKKLWKKLHGKEPEDDMPLRSSTDKKLLTTLQDKDKYIVHYRNLQLYLDLGMEIKQIHRILQFHQDSWMKQYIDFNTDRRKHSTSTFQKNFYKLMNCSVFGKTMENVRKHKNIELVHTKTRLKKISAKPTYKTAKIFSEDLVAVELGRQKVKLFKPCYSGMCILDLSKLAMYDFYYNHLKQKYGSRIELQMTDTDSLLFYCETEDLYKDMEEDLQLYDTSDFPINHTLHSDVNKKALGKMKDETIVPISEFVGLRSKMYSFRLSGLEDQLLSGSGGETKRAKGIAKVTVQKELCFNHYKTVLFSETQKHSSMTTIQSRNHELFCDTIVKTGLSAFDDKRYLLNPIDSLSYGHYLLQRDDIRSHYDCKV